MQGGGNEWAQPEAYGCSITAKQAYRAQSAELDSSDRLCDTTALMSQNVAENKPFGPLMCFHLQQLLAPDGNELFRDMLVAPAATMLANT
jgi:hypothetical protein